MHNHLVTTCTVILFEYSRFQCLKRIFIRGNNYLTCKKCFEKILKFDNILQLMIKHVKNGYKEVMYCAVWI